MAAQADSPSPTSEKGAGVKGLLDSGRVGSIYQPIVDLADHTVVGFEALARGPVGSSLEQPEALFEAARAEGLLGTLDRACRRAAIEGAREGRLRPSETLFVNLEPATLRGEEEFDEIAEMDTGGPSLVVELTERALASHPRRMLAAVRSLKERGCRVAIDDVGVDPRSLALMPFLSLDLIKLDARLVGERMPAPDIARIISAVGAEAERSGAILVAEGIKDEEHLQRARALGARLGQGWLFGRPGQIPEGRGEGGPPPGPAEPLPLPPTRADVTPFELVAADRAVRVADKRLLLDLALQFEAEARQIGPEALILATFQDAGFFTPKTRRRYERIARDAALVGALGVGIPREPGAGIRGASLLPDDRLAGEWDIILIAPRFAAALVARDLGDTGPDMERRMEYFLSYDRPLAIEAARVLLARLAPSSS